MSRTPRLFVVSGPSGVGKGTLVSLLRDQRSDLGLTVSATTREPRPGEEDGVSYHFIDDAEFDRMVAAGEFLEWANVHEHRYGTPRFEVAKNLEVGRSVILEIDVQGALNVRSVEPSAVLVFIEPPSMEVLETRLRGRGTEDEENLRVRLANAAGELALAGSYDERIVNDDLDTSVAALSAIIDSYQTN